jgi:hypothetical protein
VLDHVQLRADDVHSSLVCGSTAASQHDAYGPIPDKTSCPASSPQGPAGTHTPGTTPTTVPSNGHTGGGHPDNQGPAAGATGEVDMSALPPPTGAEGLLGDIGHLLGGLLG